MRLHLFPKQREAAVCTAGSGGIQSRNQAYITSSSSFMIIRHSTTNISLLIVFSVTAL